MENGETNKDINVSWLVGRSCGNKFTRNFLRGEAATQNPRQSLSNHQHSKKRQNLNSYSRNEGKKPCLRTNSAKPYGRQTNVVQKVDTWDDDYLHETTKRLKPEFKGRIKNKKRKVVHRKVTKDNDDMLDEFLGDQDFEIRTRLFISLTDCVEDSKCSKSTCRQTLPIIHVNTSITDNENQNQIIETIKQIQFVQKENKMEKRKSGVIRIRWIRSTILLLLLALSFLGVLEANTTDFKRDAEIVKCNLMTKPVLFGESVEIECLIQSGNKNTTMAWRKIPKGEIIALNTKPVDVGKYDAKIVYTSSKTVYILTIKTFNSPDVNVIYRCAYGFMSAGEKLFLNEKYFIAKPSEKDVKFSFSLTDTELSGNIQIRNGYPAPTCTGYFQGQNISEIVISNTNSSVLFDSKIEIKQKTTICKGTIMVTCKYGNRDVLIKDEINVCSSTTEYQSHSNRLLYGIAIASGVLLLILVMGFTIRKLCRTQYIIVRR